MKKNSLRLVALLTLTITITRAGQVEKLIEANQIENKSVFIPQKLGEIALVHDKKGFKVKKKEKDEIKKTRVQSCFIDKELRGISKENLKKFLDSGALLAVNSVGEDQYSIKLKGGLKGGGAFGATIGSAIGYTAVHILGYGACAIVSAPVALVNPAAGGAVFFGLMKTTTVLIQPVATHAAAVCGLVGAVATGPI